MRDLYSKLFESYEKKCGSKQVDIKDAAVFAARKGCKYRSNEQIKLMIIGRATNGWKKFSCFENEAEFDAGFEWVKNDGTKLYSSNDDGTIYNLAYSSFWRVAENVWRKLTNSKEERWIDNIVWSNLYKISRQNANPTVRMCRIQFPACRDILQREIDSFSPTHILMMTDFHNWVKDSHTKNTNIQCDFSSVFENENDKFEVLGNKGNYVEAVMRRRVKGKAQTIVITKRPERKKEEKFVEEIMKYFEPIR